MHIFSQFEDVLTFTLCTVIKLKNVPLRDKMYPPRRFINNQL